DRGTGERRHPARRVGPVRPGVGVAGRAAAARRWEAAMTAANDHSAGPVSRAWAAWCRFWFTPADPTPLCLMRIVAGLLVLYVHVAHTLPLHPLVGPDG